MTFARFLKKREPIVALDVGSTGVKFVALDLKTEPATIMAVAHASLSADAFSQHIIVKNERIAEQIRTILEDNGIEDRRVATAVPGPSVFSKRIKVPNLPYKELRSHIEFEAGNFIPHSVEAVRLDFHVVGEAPKNQLDVIVFAAKNEVLDSFIGALAAADVETAIVDIESLALQNAFEQSYPELHDKTVALVNIGARYACINITRAGQTLFLGDVSTGGKLLTDALSEELGISPEEAELKKRAANISPEVQDMLALHVDYVAGELNRQLTFSWSSTGSEEGIDLVLLSGGGSLVAGLPQAVTEKTTIPCELMDPFRGLTRDAEVDEEVLRTKGALMAVAVGLALREPGDRETQN